MGFLSRFEGKMEDTVEGAASKMAGAPLSPVQIAKKAEKQMRREKMVGAGKQYAPTLYTVLVNPDDDERLFGYYPTLAGETETYLAAKAAEQGLVMDGQPLVRFIVDDELKHGKFDVIAEAVAAPIVAQLRDEEMQRYGLAPQAGGYGARGGYPQQGYAQSYGAPRGGAARRPQPQPAYGYDDYGYADDQAGYGSYDEYDAYGAQDAPAPAQQGGYDPAYDDLDRADAPDGNAPFDHDEGGEAALFAAPAGNAAASAAAGAAAGAAAAGAAAGPARAARPAQAPQNQRVANTVVFAGGENQPLAPAPHETAQARLIDTTNNRAYTLIASRLMIGRESKNDIVVSDINASRSHAELTCDPQGTWVITDLGSTNGTLVNGFEVASQPLQEGDRITIGTTNYVFTYRK